jgi:CoA-transferase family III
MFSVSTFGQSGPLAHQPGYDFIGQAYAGVTSLSGEEGGDYYPPITAIGAFQLAYAYTPMRPWRPRCSIANSPARGSISICPCSIPEILPFWRPLSATMC